MFQADIMVLTRAKAALAALYADHVKASGALVEQEQDDPPLHVSLRFKRELARPEAIAKQEKFAKERDELERVYDALPEELKRGPMAPVKQRRKYSSDFLEKLKEKHREVRQRARAKRAAKAAGAQDKVKPQSDCFNFSESAQQMPIQQSRGGKNCPSPEGVVKHAELAVLKQNTKPSRLQPPLHLSPHSAHPTNSPMTPLRRAAALQLILGRTFKDLGTLLQAAPGLSFNQTPTLRLALIGDRALGLVLRERLFVELPGITNGEMSRRCQILETNRNLAAVGRRVGLDRFAFRSSEMPPCDKSVADTVEAVIGAAYLEDGITGAAELVAHLGIV
ncbi:uncharacterized protein PV09_04509 [Verruconis gallopava]|uniref:RNase III domain-containing protein n=1 Tax=Verruconis gallopava TaxID=253628 RepID=A0A0D1XNQ1_9PEZI|nr:uncharacterized protein PV09_04509 [Verruconis gallopava]KIW04201.1 hypothetical protein PV09_04509 [Verruconis gallopava]